MKNGVVNIKSGTVSLSDLANEVYQKSEASDVVSEIDNPNGEVFYDEGTEKKELPSSMVGHGVICGRFFVQKKMSIL